MNNKEKAIKLINAIFSKVWKRKMHADAPMMVQDISARTISVMCAEISDMDKDLAVIELFGICDDIHSTPFFGPLLVPDRIDVIKTPDGYLLRSDYEVTDEMIEQVLNDPLFDMESVMVGDVQFVLHLHPSMRDNNREYGSYIGDETIIESNDLWDVLRNTFG